MSISLPPLRWLRALAALSLTAWAPPAGPPRTIILFVADWCAPCHAEVERLPEIVAAARPWRVLVAQGDAAPDDRLLARVPADRRWTPPDGAARRAFLSATAGLPYAVALDAAGRICADTRRGLDGARAALLVTACSPSRSP